MALTPCCALRRRARPTRPASGEVARRHGEDREVRALPLLARTLRAAARAVVRCQPAAGLTHPRAATLRFGRSALSSRSTASCSSAERSSPARSPVPPSTAPPSTAPPSTAPLSSAPSPPARPPQHALGPRAASRRRVCPAAACIVQPCTHACSLRVAARTGRLLHCCAVLTTRCRAVYSPSGIGSLLW